MGGGVHKAESHFSFVDQLHLLVVDLGDQPELYLRDLFDDGPDCEELVVVGGFVVDGMQ